MQIVDTTTSLWELIVPNTRGGDDYRKVMVAAQGGDQVSYDVRLEHPPATLPSPPTSSSRIDVNNYVDAVIQLRWPFARRASHSRRAHSVSHQVSAPMVSTVKPASASSRASTAPAQGMPTGTPRASATSRT
jgi:hypothetical protein